jgi:threonine dehydratase
LDEIVTVSNADLRKGMRHLHRLLGLTVEPACAASFAATYGPLKDTIEGKKVGIILCGSNCSLEEYLSYYQEFNLWSFDFGWHS